MMQFVNKCNIMHKILVCIEKCKLYIILNQRMLQVNLNRYLSLANECLAANNLDDAKRIAYIVERHGYQCFGYNSVKRGLASLVVRLQTIDAAKAAKGEVGLVEMRAQLS